MDDSVYKSRIRAWCLYDWANSAFATTVMAALLPIFFRDVATTTLAQSNQSIVTSIWGYTTSAAMLIVGILSLILGPVADFGSSKKRFLAAFILLGTVSTALLGLTGAGDWLAVVVLFILGNIGFAGSEVFYDSMLPHLARPGDMDRVSTLGYALGYVGGGILLVLNIGMIAFLPSVSVLSGSPEVPLLGMRLSFVSVAIWWAAFSVPLFLRIPEPPGVQHGLGGENPMRIALQRLSHTFRNIRRYRSLFLFIMAFWFYNDGIGTIIKMAAVYGKEIGIGTMDMVGALLLTQVIGVPCSIGFGKMAGRIGAKRAILAGLVVYAGISIGGYFMTRALHFWILASAVGLVQGGTQGLSRSLYGALLPREKSSEFFGFFNISGKFAGIAGPAVFGLAGQLSGSSRLGVLSLIFFFVIGGCLLLFVKEAEPARP